MTEARRELAFGEEALPRGLGNHAVDRGFAGVQVGNPRARNDSDVGVRENVADGGQGHDGVAQPVGGAHADPRHGGGIKGHCDFRIAVALQLSCKAEVYRCV